MARVLKILRSFWFNLLAIALGVAIGLLSPEAGKSLRLVGQLYLSLLTMTVLPIVFSAITHGVGQLLRSGQFKKCLGYLLVVFAVGIFLGSTLGLMAGVFGKPGSDLKKAELKQLGSLILSAKTQHPAADGHADELQGFLHQLVPRNVFRAFVDGRSLAVILLSILMGIALGTNRSKPSDHLLETMRGIYETFFRIMGWILYGLPLGLCCIIADYVATVGAPILLVLLKLIILFYSGCLVLCLVYLCVMRFITGRTFGTILSSLKDALLLAFVASNSMVAMPMAMQGLEENLQQQRKVVELVVPLATAMNRHGYPLLFALVTVYVSQAYGHSLGFLGLLQVCFASAFVGMASVGPAASVAPMAAVVISLAGLPTELGIVALVETSAVVTPMVAMTHLFGSCATATIVSTIEKHQEGDSGEDRTG